MGPIGSGKSVACCIDLFNIARSQAPGRDGKRKTRFAIIRNTYSELRTTTIKTWHEWFPKEWGTWRAEGPPTHHIMIGDIDMEVMFIALDRPDDVKKLLSLELTAGWINEAREVPKAVLDALTGRVGRYPSQKKRPENVPREEWPTFYGVLMDTNPPDDEHWWYKLAEEETPHNFQFFRQPGGRDKDAENIENLPAGYYDNASAGKDDEWVKVYVNAQYGAVMDGKPVYPDYNDRIHCEPCKPTPGIRIMRGWDFGLTPSCVFTQQTPTGQWKIFDELVAEDMGIDRFSDLVIAHSQQYYPDYEFEDIGDPAGNMRAQTDERTCFDILHGKGIKISGGDQDPNIRIESVKKPLSMLIEGKPAFTLDPECKTLRKGFLGGYQYRRMMTSKERYADKPEKNRFSHIHDALQYVATRLFASQLRGKIRAGNINDNPWSFENLIEAGPVKRMNTRERL